VLTSCSFTEKIKDVDMAENATKCVKGFRATYNFYGGYSKEINQKVCFNGEFNKYLASSIIRKYFPNWSLYLERMQVAADHEKLLKSTTKKAIKLLKAVSDPDNTEEDLKDLLKKVKKFRPCEEANINVTTSSKRDTIRVAKQSRKPSVLYFGHNKTISFPTLREHIKKLSKHPNNYAIKSPSSKRVFMYSSPWAAAKSLSLYKNQTFNLPDERNLKEGSYCQLSKRYLSVARSLSDCISSYKHANQKHLTMSSFLNKGRAKLAAVYNTSVAHLSKPLRKDALFWLKEYKKGSDLYGNYVGAKLSDFNVHGMNRWKENAARTLSNQFKGSVSTVEGYLHALNSNTMKAISRSNVPVTDQKQLQNLSQLINSVLSPGKVKTLQELSEVIKPIKDSVNAFASGISKSC